MKKDIHVQKKPNYSKLLCSISIAQFVVIIGIYIYALIMVYDTSAFAYIFPSSAAIVTAVASFYMQKSKAENLSKQKIRNVYLALFLQGQMSPEAYQKIEVELSNIDSMVDMKLDSMLQDSINMDIGINQ